MISILAVQISSHAKSAGGELEQEEAHSAQAVPIRTPRLPGICPQTRPLTASKRGEQFKARKGLLHAHIERSNVGIHSLSDALTRQLHRMALCLMHASDSGASRSGFQDRESSVSVV